MKPREGSTAQIGDFLGGDQLPAGSDRLWEKEMRMRRDQTGDVVRSTVLAIVVSRGSWRESFSSES